MCRVCSLIGGLVMIATLAGCSESAPESGTVPYKPTTSPVIEGLNKQIAEQAKKGTPANKKEEASKSSAESKPSDTKPAAEPSKPEEKKKD
jgi:hypothetical protein